MLLLQNSTTMVTQETSVTANNSLTPTELKKMDRIMMGCQILSFVVLCVLGRINCCWPSLAQSFSVQGPVEIMTIYSLSHDSGRLEIPISFCVCVHNFSISCFLLQT
jgi:hypothetical protein